MSRLRLVVVEDHRLLREALVALLEREAGLEVVGQAGTAAEALAQVKALAPDVLLLDVGLPDGSGIDVARRLTGSPTRVLVISVMSGAKHVQEALRAGVSGYMTKNAAKEELVRAVRIVGEGSKYVSPELFRSLYRVNVDVGRDDGEPPPVTVLGTREREVLALVARGLRTLDIAEKLDISPATVEVHRRNISRKLGLRGVADFTKYALREGLIAP